MASLPEVYRGQPLATISVSHLRQGAKLRWHVMGSHCRGTASHLSTPEILQQIAKAALGTCFWHPYFKWQAASYLGVLHAASLLVSPISSCCCLSVCALRMSWDLNEILPTELGVYVCVYGCMYTCCMHACMHAKFRKGPYSAPGEHGGRP